MYYQQIIDRIIKKYGESIIEDFEKVKYDRTLNLSNLGKKYNFTREFARQIFEKINKEPYSKFRKLKRENQEIKIPVPVLTKTQELVFNICQKLGYKFEKKGYNIYINNSLVCIRSATHAYFCAKRSGVKYFRTYTDKTEKDYKLLIFYNASKDRFFIIPSSYLKGIQNLYISEEITENSKNFQKFVFQNFLNAWHLLKE